MDSAASQLTDAKDIADALKTIRFIEVMGYALEEQSFKLKFSESIFHCMNILRDMHDQLVARLPPEVIEAEQAKAKGQSSPPPLNQQTVPMGVA